MNASRTRWLSGFRRPLTGGRVEPRRRQHEGHIGQARLGHVRPGHIRPGRGGFDRLSRSQDIQRLFRAGRFSRTRGLKLGYAANGLGHHRVAFAPTRSLRRAVDRNRQKRISREAYRQLVGRIAGSYDLVFVIYGDATTTTRERRSDMATVLGTARLLQRRAE